LLARETTTRDGHTQTGVSHSCEKATNTFTDVTDAATQVSNRPHVWSSATQTEATVASTHDQSTPDHLRPRRYHAFSQTARPAYTQTFTQTARPGTFHRGAQTDRPALNDSSMSMAPVLVATTGCQAGAHYSNDVIPPGVLRPRLPWAYTYEQLEALLLAYPTVHPEDFVTFGVF